MVYANEQMQPNEDQVAQEWTVLGLKDGYYNPYGYGNWANGRYYGPGYTVSNWRGRRSANSEEKAPSSAEFKVLSLKDGYYNPYGYGNWAEGRYYGPGYTVSSPRSRRSVEDQDTEEDNYSGWGYYRGWGYPGYRSSYYHRRYPYYRYY